MAIRIPKGKINSIPRRYASGGQRKFVLERDSYRCRYCGVSLMNKTAVIDHVRPWKYGGKTKTWNLVSACEDCNGKKLNKRGWKPAKLEHLQYYAGRSDLEEMDSHLRSI